MARVEINTGASANDGTGNNLRAAGGILNSNFLELYTYLGEGSTTVLSAPLWSSTNAGINTIRNVGIGTTNPTSALTVTGDVKVTGVVTATSFVGSGTNLTGIVTSIVAGTNVTVSGSTGQVTINSTASGGGSSQFVTTAAGIHTLSNVGIGTTNPRFILEVGAVGASGTTLFVNGDARVTGIVTIGTASITLNGITNTINVGTGITINGSTGIISATAIVLGGTTLTGAAVTFITAGSGISIDQGTGNVTITATGGGGSSQFVTTAAGIHTLSNVGIGTTNPTSKLQVERYGVSTGFGTFSATAGIATDIDTFAISSIDFKTVEYTLHFTNDSNIQAQKVLVMQNGTTSYSQEYGIMFEPNRIVSIGAIFSSGVCKLQATPESGISGLVIYRIVRQGLL